ncbi:MAG: SDR family NAD(P)-dependent oxidoreductase [Acidobacteriota bacterium]
MPADRKAVDGTAWVTGASSGIGAAVAAGLAARGRRVLGLARRIDKIETAGGVEAAALDLGDLDAVPGRLDRLLRERGVPDVAVLAAGKGLLGALEEASYRQIRALVDLDLTAQILIARALVPAMKRRGRGDLVFIGSEAALRGRRRGAVYCAAKFGLRGFAQALREECATAGLRISTVHPGPVRTDFFAGLEVEPGPEPEHALDPEDVARAVCDVLELPASAVVDEVVLSPRVAQVRRRKRPR